MEILIIIAPSFLALFLGYILGRDRDSSKIIFNKKLEIYSDIVYCINSANFLKVDLGIHIQDFHSAVKKYNDDRKDVELDLKNDMLNNNSAYINKEKAYIDYLDSLIKLFAPARLIGGRAVTNELRNFFSLVSEYFSIENKENLDDLRNKISKSSMELEQSMRKDLGRFRTLSKLDIWLHARKH